MAETERTNPQGFVDKRRVQSSDAGIVATPANYASLAAMKTRLQTINATYYTNARLRKMTYNDVVFALRREDDAAGIK